jgi:hypothetical protein
MSEVLVDYTEPEELKCHMCGTVFDWQVDEETQEIFPTQSCDCPMYKDIIFTGC